MMLTAVIIFVSLLSIGFFVFTYKIAASISVVVKQISLLTISFIHVVTIYFFVASECLDSPKVETNEQLKLHCRDILGKHLGASFGTLFGLFILSVVWASFKPTNKPRQTLFIPVSHQATVDNFYVQNVQPLFNPPIQIETVPAIISSTTLGVPPNYWPLIRTEGVHLSETHIQMTKNNQGWAIT